MRLRKVTASRPSIRRWSYVRARFMMGLQRMKCTMWSIMRHRDGRERGTPGRRPTAGEQAAAGSSPGGEEVCI